MGQLEPEIICYASPIDPADGNSRLRRLFFFVLCSILVIVIVLIIVSPGATICTEENRAAAAISDYGPIATAIKVYQLHTGHYPPSLRDLSDKPAGESNWLGPYIEDPTKLVDPWSNTYQYRCPGKNGRSYDLWSMGSDKVSGTIDDIVK